MIRAALAGLLTATLWWASPAEADPTPVPFVPLPTAYDQLPLGPATSYPWRQAGVLHIGSTAIRTRYHDLVSRNGVTVIGHNWTHGRGRSTAVLVEGSKLVGLPIRGLVRFGPRLSADGHWLTWLDEERTTHVSQDLDRVRYRLVLYDTTTRRIVRQHREARVVDTTDGRNGLVLISVSNLGQVLISVGDQRKRIMTPTRDLRPLRGRTHTLIPLYDGWPSGITVHRGRSQAAVYGTVSSRGRFHRVGTTASSFGIWSASGDGFAYQDSGHGDGGGPTTYWVEHPASGTTVQLGLPADRELLDIVGWEGPGTVLLWDANQYAVPPYSQLLRCDAATGACQRVNGGPVPGRAAELAHF